VTDSSDTLSGYIDVRDLARAHVGALSSPPEAAVGRKRLLMASPHDLNYETAIDFIAEKRPELRDRLADGTKAPKFPIDRMDLDIQRVEEVTGVKVDSYIPWQDTILGTVDDLIKLEKDWVSKGFSVEVPPA
jgi:nucleoside-diphosphate-sugar epimerase